RSYGDWSSDVCSSDLCCPRSSSSVLLPVAAADPNSKIADDTFLAAPFGIGMRKGDTEMKAWVDSRLEQMRKKDQFLPILKANVRSEERRVGKDGKLES